MLLHETLGPAAHQGAVTGQAWPGCVAVQLGPGWWGVILNLPGFSLVVHGTHRLS